MNNVPIKAQERYMEKDIWEKVYFEKPYSKPFLFFVLFGTDNIDGLTVSRSRHNIGGMPDELQIINYSKLESEEQKNYIEGFYSGYLGKSLKEKNNILYENITDCNNVTIIKGEFDDNNTLDFLKDSIGIIQAIIETGITAVLDIQIMEWFEPEEWSKKYFSPKAPNVFDHVIVLWSEEDNKIWLHTRGMRKFGRPDLSIRKVAAGKRELGLEIINRLIQSFAYGLIPDETKEIKLNTMEKGVYGRILGNYDDLDFNNYYFEIDEL